MTHVGNQAVGDIDTPVGQPGQSLTQADPSQGSAVTRQKRFGMSFGQPAETPLQHLQPERRIANGARNIDVIACLGAALAEQVVGMHFMNPVPVMKLVELVRGIATEDFTFEAAKAFVVSLDKTVTVAEDFPAFIVNRILLPMINEAIYVLYEGVGSVEAIDTAMKLGANHPMGPLQLADFIGLDTCLSIMQVLHDGLSDSKYRPCPLLVKYVEAGWLGRKAGRGFYDYRGENPVPTR